MRRMTTALRAIPLTAAVCLLGVFALTAPVSALPPAAQPPAARPAGQQPPAEQGPAADLVKQGQQQLREGRHEEALALYRKALQAAPDSFPANLQAGVVLDLLGRYGEARERFTKAIQVAGAPPQKIQAMRAMAVSYAFENDCKDAGTYEQQAYDAYLTAKDFYNAGEVADELARICLEAGNLDEAERWYRTGHDVGWREPDIKPERRDLWDFRWEHAQARIAARRGNKGEARKHVEAAKAAVDKLAGTDSANQAQFFPYLTGYVAYYTGDYKQALADLQKANQNDPFILCLIAQTCEKLGDKAQATEYFKKALASNAHNPPNAFARPLAKKALGS